MVERLVSTLNVAFDGDADGVGDGAGKNRIILLQATKRFDFKGQLWLHAYCGIPYSLTASVGSVLRGPNLSRTIWRESLKFNNSSSATLKYPTASGVSLTTGVLMKKVKNLQGQTRIVPASDVFLRYDAEQTAVIAESGVAGRRSPTPVYGVAFVQYTATYDLLFYTPAIENIGNAVGDGVQWTLGTVFAYHEYDVASVDMELDMTSAETTAEYARVYSKIVLDSKGVWEFPPNWQTTYENNQKKTGEARADYESEGRFPNYSATIDADNSFVDERVHLIVKVDNLGRLIYEYPKGIVSIYAPYWEWSNYEPQYHLRYGEPPNGAKASSQEDFIRRLNNRGWDDVFLDVDKTAFELDIKKNYKDIIIDSNGNT